MVFSFLFHYFFVVADLHIYFLKNGPIHEKYKITNFENMTTYFKHVLVVVILTNSNIEGHIANNQLPAVEKSGKLYI